MLLVLFLFFSQSAYSLCDHCFTEHTPEELCCVPNLIDNDFRQQGDYSNRFLDIRNRLLLVSSLISQSSQNIEKVAQRIRFIRTLFNNQVLALFKHINMSVFNSFNPMMPSCYARIHRRILSCIHSNQYDEYLLLSPGDNCEHPLVSLVRQLWREGVFYGQVFLLINVSPANNEPLRRSLFEVTYYQNCDNVILFLQRGGTMLSYYSALPVSNFFTTLNGIIHILEHHLHSLSLENSLVNPFSYLFRTNGYARHASRVLHGESVEPQSVLARNIGLLRQVINNRFMNLYSEVMIDIDQSDSNSDMPALFPMSLIHQLRNGIETLSQQCESIIPENHIDQDIREFICRMHQSGILSGVLVVRLNSVNQEPSEGHYGDLFDLSYVSRGGTTFISLLGVEGSDCELVIPTGQFVNVFYEFIPILREYICSVYQRIIGTVPSIRVPLVPLSRIIYFIFLYQMGPVHHNCREAYKF